MPTLRRAGLAVLALLAPMGVLAACSSDDDSASSTTGASSTTTTAAAEELTILVTNDDGVGAQGIDVLVQALQAMPETKVVVAAPAENQSGTGGRTTPGGATATPTTMLSGEQATAVAGFPADSVVWALDGGIPETPQLVVSGINSGQNVGAFIQLSGTVGAARAAASRGIPALAVSAGVNDTAGFDEAAELAVAWIDEHRGALLDGSMATTPAPVANLNVPGCSAGEVRGVLEVPASADPPASLEKVDCGAPEPPTKPADDNAALAGGWAALSDIGVG
ncbi:5'/3'-nucleotidase SurE [Dermatobacter hominis]|uniref:5'/3'-nucleotidase SurE n=1 Tax=Dermatobacter hominis TaxID=2884263 RepID=UPI001D1076CA|nr:5'/3'-nucleotidase SurE [Dermatobacter hominis]UDY35372.1 5'/3'-nucleotidase SurE [Dermatobacter hominis]